MRKVVFVLLFILVYTQNSFCQQSELSRVLIYRENNFNGSVANYRIYANDSLIIKLKNNSFYVYYCKPGNYNFGIDNPKDIKLKLKTEAGRTYYLRFGIVSGFWTTSTELISVDSVSASAPIRSGKMRELGENMPPLIRPKARIGGFFGFGFPFKKYPMFTTNTNEESSISFGGGYLIGLKLGYEVSKFIDLSVSVNYQLNSLTPELKNAETDFERFIISLTPSYIIPIDDGESMRVKVGAGIDYFISPKLTINTTQINGEIGKCYYSDKFTYHLEGDFEVNFSESWSFTYGIKWYQLNYLFKSGTVQIPSNNELFNPIGSGIDLFLVMNYHF